jgi:hypothetical protein
MDKLIEKVARAIYSESVSEAERVVPDCAAPGFDEDDEDVRKFCRQLAKAAIEASGVERAVEALTFYAAKGNYGVRKVVSGVRYSDADLDGGSKARETLSLINGVEP